MSSLPHRQLRNTGWCSKALPNRVHCRIGSSETSQGCVSPGASVHCRIGSSESKKKGLTLKADVHCRIGSSEKREDAGG